MTDFNLAVCFQNCQSTQVNSLPIFPAIVQPWLSELAGTRQNAQMIESSDNRGCLVTYAYPCTQELRWSVCLNNRVFWSTIEAQIIGFKAQIIEVSLYTCTVSYNWWNMVTIKEQFRALLTLLWLPTCTVPVRCTIWLPMCPLSHYVSLHVL